MAILKSFLRDESGATAIEYGLIAAGISVAIIVTVNALGTKLNTTFDSMKNQAELTLSAADEKPPELAPFRANRSETSPGHYGPWVACASQQRMGIDDR